MDSRREFLKKAAMLTGGAGIFTAMPSSLVKALSINPAAGSTWLDAEHIVILMQENRSFDHCYGSLAGVRGYNDPRAMRLPDGDPVWFQKNKQGETYAPFRLNIKETKSTWTGSLPHSWTNQVDARNKGLCDQWLIAKPSGHPEFARAPLTMGYYNRQDIPFYYALADAFTICDQNFSSSLTGTTANRLYLWTGTIRSKPNPDAYANVRNENVNYENEADWTTFPERLEDENISWKIYQNELSIPSGLSNEEDSWLANFTDNPIEWFTQYNVRFSATHRSYMKKVLETFPDLISELEGKIEKGGNTEKEITALKKELVSKRKMLAAAQKVDREYTTGAFDKLSEREKNLHKKAFSTNERDPDYRSIENYNYQDGDSTRSMSIPKGDVLHQFRSDVKSGALPAVSWVVGPENFSDHPGAPWYGAWYVSEVIDILTQNPEVWKKTIFVLCYDENDGYFDHVPPFVPPDPYTPDSGKVSAGIDCAVEYVTIEQDEKRSKRSDCRHSPIGLGYRVPLVIASPWSRGGQVCSQVFDHTSILMLIEKWLSHKTGRDIREPNISAWRRTVCGDLTSVFQPYSGDVIAKPEPVKQMPFFESIHKAKLKKNPAGYRRYTRSEIDQWQTDPAHNRDFAQEPGTRKACAIPYELTADGNFDLQEKKIIIEFGAGNNVFGSRAAGAAFIVYKHNPAPGIRLNSQPAISCRNYAVKAGDYLTDEWLAEGDADKGYYLSVYGVNGFFRVFAGGVDDPLLHVKCGYSKKSRRGTLSGDVELLLTNTNKNLDYDVIITDDTYAHQQYTLKIAAGRTKKQVINSSEFSGWYNFTLSVKGNDNFFRQFAGHVETGKASLTDPVMGRQVSR
ncbi:MAG: phospholipase C, phosphocholine-specific [Chitinophagaceae bacterium]|nr:MAG: phospholipase C, phosphocholine-specific [Chitinophagaceae bacterium]